MILSLNTYQVHIFKYIITFTDLTVEIIILHILHIIISRY